MKSKQLLIFYVSMIFTISLFPMSSPESLHEVTLPERAQIVSKLNNLLEDNFTWLVVVQRLLEKVAGQTFEPREVYTITSDLVISYNRRLSRPMNLCQTREISRKIMAILFEGHPMVLHELEEAGVLL